MKNDFFDFSELKHLGKNVIIGKHVRIRHPERVSIGDYSIIDDFTYISTHLTVGRFVHIGANTVIMGGDGACIYEDFSTSAPGCSLVTCSDDYVSGMGSPIIPRRFKGDAVVGKIHLQQHVVLGTNTVVFPNVTLHAGAATAAMTVVNKDLQEWVLYAGIPARKVKNRDREKILGFARQFLEEYESNGQRIVP